MSDWPPDWPPEPEDYYQARAAAANSSEPTPQEIAPGCYRCRRCNHEWAGESRDCPFCDVTEGAVEVPRDRGTVPETGFLARLRARFARFSRSEIQPGIVTDRSGESGIGLWWRRKLPNRNTEED